MHILCVGGGFELEFLESFVLLVGTKGVCSFARSLPGFGENKLKSQLSLFGVINQCNVENEALQVGGLTAGYQSPPATQHLHGDLLLKLSNNGTEADRGVQVDRSSK